MNSLAPLSSTSKSASFHRTINPETVVRDARRCLADPALRDQPYFVNLLDTLDCESSGISMKLRREVAVLKRSLDVAAELRLRRSDVCRSLDF
jgi:hypothetical protein